jgi:hypothetical protein
MRCHSVGLWFLLASRCTPALKTSFHAMKLVKTLGALIIVIALLLLWHHFLISSRRSKLKAWESCKTKILDDWAARRGDPVPDDAKVRRRAFVRDHFYSFGATSSTNRFDDHDSRNTAVNDAGRIGVTKGDLILIDSVIAFKCGAFPRQ